MIVRKLKKNQPLVAILTTILLFGLAVGYNRLRANQLLAEKKVFPQGIPELKEHNQSQGNLILETAKFDEDLALVLGAKENIGDLKLKILNNTQVPGLAAAAKEFFIKEGFSSITIGDASGATYSATLIEFQPERQEQAEFIRYLISEDLEVELGEIERAATASMDFNPDIIITLATSSALFKPYFPTPTGAIE